MPRETEFADRTIVAILTSSFSPREGGAERQIRQVFARISSDPLVRTTVYTEGIPGEQHRVIVDGIPTIRTSNSPRFLGKPGRQLVYMLESLARLFWTNPSVVVTSQLGAPTIAGGIFAKARGLPLIVRLSGSKELSTDGSYSYDPLGRQDRKWPIIKWLLASERTYVVAPAGHLLRAASDQMSLSRHRTRIIPNGVETSRMSTSVADATHAIWYGRNVLGKGGAAFESLVRITPDVAFRSIGDAALRPQANLTRLGWVHDSESEIGRAKVAVSTSRAEGSPNFALQAIARGIPVIGFEIPALRELAKEYVGYIQLVPMGDVTGLAHAVRHGMAAEPLPPAPVPSLEQVTQVWLSLLQEASRNSRALLWHATIHS